jgi:hypothetical protein
VARRRPTLPRLETQYHGRWGVSRPCSGWERVYQPRDGHQATGPDPRMSGWDDQECCVCCVIWRCARWMVAHPCGDVWDMEFYRVIRTARLHSLRSFHLRPIDVVVYHGP